jgi:hypothetical protein
MNTNNKEPPQQEAIRATPTQPTKIKVTSKEQTTIEKYHHNEKQNINTTNKNINTAHNKNKNKYNEQQVSD